jgi:hypothetical protein
MLSFGSRNCISSCNSLDVVEELIRMTLIS